MLRRMEPSISWSSDMMKNYYWRQHGRDFYLYEDGSYKLVEKVTFKEDANLGVGIEYAEPGLADVARIWFLRTYCPKNNILLLN